MSHQHGHLYPAPLIVVAVVQALPITERMPILVYAIDPQYPEVLASRRREARAKGVFSYDVTLEGVIGSLFSAFS